MQAQLHLVLEMHRHCPHARWSHPDRSRVAAIKLSPRQGNTLTVLQSAPL